MAKVAGLNLKSRRWPGVVAAVLLLLVEPGCVTEQPDGPVRRREVDAYTVDEQGRRGGKGPGADPAAFPPGLLSPVVGESVESTLSPYHRFSHETLRAPDGRLTRLYWVRAGRGKMLQQLIQAHTRAFPENQESDVDLSLVEGAQIDPRPADPPKGVLSTMIAGVAAVSDLITVTADEDIVLEVDQFLSAVLTETPQIEIEGRVVEISFNDGIDIGVNFFIEEQTPKFTTNEDGTQSLIGEGNDPRTLFNQFKSPLDPGSFLSNKQVGSLALAFIDSDVRYRAIIRAIQDSGSADVLSQPKMAVLNGHRAVVDAGSKTPILQPVLGTAGNLTQVQVRYEDTGVKLIVTPYLLMDDVIQVDITAEVSFVSGFIESGASGILNPVISTRTASTVVNVRDGQTFAIGGLVSTDELEVVKKIPLLGDIPLLGYLFKTRQVTETQSQVIFFVTPRLIRRAAPLFDPGG